MIPRRLAARPFALVLVLGAWSGAAPLPRSARAGESGYTPTPGLERLRDAVTGLDGEDGAALSDVARRSFKARANALLSTEEAQRRGDTPLDAEVKGASTTDARLATEGAALARRAAELKARGASAGEKAALKAEAADYNRRLEAHRVYTEGLAERVTASNRLHEQRIARLLEEILDGMHPILVLAPNRMPTREFAKPEEVTSTAARLATSRKYRPIPRESGGLTTFCNFFLRDLADRVFQYRAFNDQKANGIADLVASGVDGWARVHDAAAAPEDATALAANLARAQALANAGLLVVAAWKNPKVGASGHVAAVVPGELAPSGAAWGKVPVPTIAQAGETVFSKGRLDAGFGADKQASLQIYVRQPNGPPPIDPPKPK